MILSLLVVGNPFALDTTGDLARPYIVAGSVGKITAGIHKDATQAAWITSNEDLMRMKNTFKMSGYQVTTGQFFRGVEKSLVVTAPKADNYRGKVHICHNCFPSYYQKSVQFAISGLKIGEHFGAAVSACDLTGDGRDDLLVGAPNYGDLHHHNTGRVHVLITTGFQFQRFALLTPPERLSGARFGSSVGCLALADSDSTNQVIVGAPYYQETGAVFVYRLRNNQMELSQTIRSPGLPTRGFGLRLSHPSQTGLGVAAPDSREVFYIRVRPVLRFQDISSVSFEPKFIDPKKDREITLKIDPKIHRLSARSEELRVSAEVETDGRLTPASLNSEHRTFTANSWRTSELRLKYKLDLSSNNLLPLHFNVALKFSLPACTDSYSKPCPVFNNIPGRTFSLHSIKTHLISSEFGLEPEPEGGEVSLTRRSESRTVNFNLCSDPAACRCEVRGEMAWGRSCGPACVTQLVVGQTSHSQLAELRLRNEGTEPSPTGLLEVRLDQAGYRLDLLGSANCETGLAGPNITRCYLFLDSNSQTRIPLRVSASQTVELSGRDGGDQHLTLSVSLRPNCHGRPQHIRAEVKIPVVTRWELRPSQEQNQESQEYYWTAGEDKGEARPVSLEYSVTNTGPSPSSGADVFVFIPRDPLVEKTEVTIDSQQCSVGAAQHVERLPAGRSEAAGDISCQLGGSCLLYHCRLDSSLQRSERKVVKVSFAFNMKKAEQRSQQTKFLVRTSLCVLKRGQFQLNHIVCKAEPTNTTITTTTVFQYFQQSPLDVLIDSWQIVVGVGASVIVFIIALLLAWRFDLFHRARILKNMEENGETSGPQQMEMEGIKD